jgi:hypothetical protein
VGAGLYRCQNCEARHAFLGTYSLPLKNWGSIKKDEIRLWPAMIAICGGVFACLAIAILTLRRFHRWPF